MTTERQLPARDGSTFRDLVEQSEEGTLVVDLDGVVRYANPAAARLFATDADALTGSLLGFPIQVGQRTEVDLLPGADAEMAEMHVQEVDWNGSPARLVSLRARPASVAGDGLETRGLGTQGLGTLGRDDGSGGEAAALRLDFLVRCGDALAGGLDADAQVDAFFAQVVPRFADWCLVWDLAVLAESPDVATTPETETLRARHVDPERLAEVERLHAELREAPTAAPSSGPSRALRGHMVLGDLDGHDTLPPALRSFLASWGDASMIHVPLVRRGGRGVLSFGLRRAAGYDPSDLALAADLARRLAMALDHCALFAATREAVRLRETFLATVSHELRTPIQATLSWVEIMRNALDGSSEPADDATSETLRRGFDIIRRNALAQSHLVEDIVDMSRVVQRSLRLELQPVDIRDVLEEVAAALRPRAARDGIRLQMRYEPLPPVAGEELRLRQVFSNLLTNALKFSSRGSAVEIVARKDGSVVEVSVRDQGRGIEPEMLARIFDPFRQVTESATRESGLGLGLSIVHSLVSLHDGTVVAESDGPGRGATFTVRLPIFAVDDESPETSTSRSRSSGSDSTPGNEGGDLLRPTPPETTQAMRR